MAMGYCTVSPPTSAFFQRISFHSQVEMPRMCCKHTIKLVTRNTPGKEHGHSFAHAQCVACSARSVAQRTEADLGPVLTRYLLVYRVSVARSSEPARDKETVAHRWSGTLAGDFKSFQCSCASSMTSRCHLHQPSARMLTAAWHRRSGA